MKIVHVISGLTKGGGERMAVELANQAIVNGDEATIVAGWPEDPAYLQHSINPGVTIKFIATSKKRSYLKIIPWILANKKWIRQQDVMHFHLTYGSVFGAAISLLLNKNRKPRPVLLETNHAVGMPVPPFNKWFHARMASMLDGMALMANDDYWSRFSKEHPKLKTVIIKNGITLTPPGNSPIQQQLVIKKLGLPQNSKYLVGSISMLRADRKPWLYVPVFVEIFKILGNQVHFVLGGAGEEYGKIEELIKAEGLAQNFHLIGLVNDPLPIISAMNVYVSVSVGETAGVSMIEAAMCSIPVVGIQLSENYKAQSEDWIWSNTDTKEVAKKIIGLLQDDDCRNKLALLQNKYALERFTSQAMFKNYLSFYQQMM